MDNKRIASKLMKLAKELKASKKISERIEDAKYMFEAGGRGVELGIREIYGLMKESEKLYKDLRKIQGRPDGQGEAQEEILKEFNKRV